MGLHASITVFPARFCAPASFSASAATLPLTASTTISPNCAASAKVPVVLPGFPADHSASLAGERLPIFTWWPCLRKPLARVFATSPDPSTPTFIKLTSNERECSSTAGYDQQTRVGSSSRGHAVGRIGGWHAYLPATQAPDRRGVGARTPQNAFPIWASH